MREGETVPGFAVGRILFSEAFVSQKFLPSILLAFVLVAFPAVAQQRAAPPAPAAGNAEALTPDQAKRALDTLSDARSPTRPRNPRHPSRNPRYRLRRTVLAHSSCFRYPSRSARSRAMSPTRCGR